MTWRALYTVAFSSVDLWGSRRRAAVHRARRPVRGVPRRTGRGGRRCLTSTATTTPTTRRPGRGGPARSSSCARWPWRRPSARPGGRAPTPSTPSSSTSSTGWARTTAPGSWPGRGSTRRSRSGCSPTGRRPPAELGIAGAEGDNVRVVENTDARPQPRRVHAVLVLPVAPARRAADLVQELRLPRSRAVAEPRAVLRRVRVRARRRRRDPRVGLQRGRSATSCSRSGRRAPRR